jgi:hypothetical protein
LVGSGRGKRRTWVIIVVQRRIENLHGSREVEERHLVVQCDEDVDGFGGIAAFSDCTHFGGVGVVLGK